MWGIVQRGGNDTVTVWRDPDAEGHTVWGLHNRKCPEREHPKTGKGFLGAGD